ncbi:MAG: zinc-ribbon domain containing protein, partial [Firmicutes bacterium]|nr:zinc-ribbon domain containing protein [Bacillota bacterium]
KGFDNEPKRCKECRDKRKAQRRLREAEAPAAVE